LTFKFVMQLTFRI